METWLQRIFLALSLASAAAAAQQVEPDIPREVVTEDLLDSENWLFSATTVSTLLKPWS